MKNPEQIHDNPENLKILAHILPGFRHHFLAVAHVPRRLWSNQQRNFFPAPLKQHNDVAAREKTCRGTIRTV